MHVRPYTIGPARDGCMRSEFKFSNRMCAMFVHKV
jgi:hypothetical protein